MKAFTRILTALALICLATGVSAQTCYYTTPACSGAGFWTSNWRGSTIPANFGGTGIANNAASTITINGAYSLGLTLSANTALTLPSAGTLATTANINTALPSITSAALGCVGDGSADNSTNGCTTAITNACSTAGCTITFQSGVFKFSTNYTLPPVFAGNAINIVGAGSNATIFYWPNASGGLK